MSRLTKRVGAGEAIPVADGDICVPFIKTGLCKTGCIGMWSSWQRKCNDECVLGMMIDRLADFEDSAEPRPITDWHDDMGNVLWWKFPVDEPPYCGSPLDENWPGYHTHFTMLVVPELPKGESEKC